MADLKIHGIADLSTEGQVRAIECVRDAAISRTRWSAIESSVVFICVAAVLCTCTVVVCG